MKALKLTLISLLLLTACSREEKLSNASEVQSNNASCIHSGFNLQIADTLQKIISTQAQQFAQIDNRQFVDANKLINVTAQLNIQITEPQIIDRTCQTVISIQLPDKILKQAAHNSPLLNTMPTDKLIQERLKNSQIQFKQNTFIFPVRYVINNNQINLLDDNLNNVANLLADALLPYAIKETLMLDGENISREEALKRLKQPKSASDLTPEILQNPIDAAEVNELPTQTLPQDDKEAENTPPEIITPDQKIAKHISNDELNQANQANQQADQALKKAWQKITPDIQQTLFDEQKTWERKKQTACSHAGAKGSDASESQYLQMQCDTRMTREQIQYLNGYSID